MTNLSELQLQCLRTAAGANDGVTASPETARTVASLIRRGFCFLLPQADGPGRIHITEAGRTALSSAVEDDPGQLSPTTEAKDEATIASDTNRSQETAADRPPTKVETLVNLLRQPGGASVDALMAATGWQAHSVRGALSGAVKKGLGLNVVSEKTEAGRIYKIGEAAV